MEDKEVEKEAIKITYPLAFKRGMLLERKKIILMIREDIKFQESRLKDDFEGDKPTRWRIVGMKSLMERLENFCEDCGEILEEPSPVEETEVCEDCFNKGLNEGRFRPNPDLI